MGQWIQKKRPQPLTQSSQAQRHAIRSWWCHCSQGPKQEHRNSKDWPHVERPQIIFDCTGHCQRQRQSKSEATYIRTCTPSCSPKNMIDLWKDTHRSPLQGQQVNKKRICKGRGFWEILQNIELAGMGQNACAAPGFTNSHTTRTLDFNRFYTAGPLRGPLPGLFLGLPVYRCSRVSPKALDTAALWSSSCESSWVALTADRTGNKPEVSTGWFQD